MDPNAALIAEATRIQASGVLGEARMRRLFDYLAAASLAGESPKEITLAIDVFGKGQNFDVSQDAVVRVYMHKLRRALDDFYALHGGEGVTPLHIPRGEYRLTLRPTTGPGPPVAAASGTLAGGPVAAAPPPASLALAQQPPRQYSVSRVLQISAALAAAVLLGVFGARHWRPPPTDLDLARQNPVWSGILKDDRPLLVVVGDYYLIGETDDSMEVKRLIREYSVNTSNRPAAPMPPPMHMVTTAYLRRAGGLRSARGR
jgi:hypothetical protein